MVHFSRGFLPAAALLAISTLAVSADDWTAAKLRGRVLQLVDQQWQPLQRGDTVPDSRVIRTMGGAQVQLTRGGETVDVESNTQIQIFDKPTSGKPYTTVKQYFGTIAVEAEVEKVQHFAVQTPSLAAVVKGTKFTVRSGATGASVSVQRGHVAVTDKNDKSHVTLSVGEEALVDTVKTGGAIDVSGSGPLPAVLNAKGQIAEHAAKWAAWVDKKAEQAAEKAAKFDGPRSDNGNSSKGNSGSGNSGNSGKDKGKKDS